MARGEGDGLVTRAKAGDEAAWEELYGDHAQRLVVWLAHLPHLDPASDAEDVAAEAWLTAARRIADFSGDRGDFAGWLFAIARNIARTRHRTTARRGTTPRATDGRSPAENAQPDPAPEVVSADVARRLIAQLSEREAQVVACIDVVGLDVATTSQALDLSAVAVRVAHHRGLARLRRILALEEQGSEPERAPDVTGRGPGDM